MQTSLTLNWNHIKNRVMFPRGPAGSIPLVTEKGYRGRSIKSFYDQTYIWGRYWRGQTR